MLKAENISYTVNNIEILKDFSYEFHTGKLYVIMGKNGAGKTTLLKLLSGSISTASGSITFKNKPLNDYTFSELAKIRAVLSQHYEIPFPIDVSELVMMGRYPHFKSNPGLNDFDICNESMQMMDVSQFKEREYNSLSGGEAKKVHLARTLSQVWDKDEEKLLFLDEPVSNLDLKYQHQIIKIAREQKNNNTCVIAVLHDINLSIQYADEIIFLKDGKLISVVKDSGSCEKELLKEIYDIEFIKLENNGKKYFFAN